MGRCPIPRQRDIVPLESRFFENTSKYVLFYYTLI